MPAGAAEDAARREKRATRLRKRLKQIDATEDAHVREVQALAELGPNSAAVTAIRTRHLKRLTQLEAGREDIRRTLAALAKEATQWAAPSFPDSGIGAISCCTLPVQILVVGFLRSPVAER